MSEQEPISKPDKTREFKWWYIFMPWVFFLANANPEFDKEGKLINK